MKPRAEITQAGTAGWLEEEALVVATFAGGVWLETQRRSGCGGCTVQGCGSGLLARWRRSPRLPLPTRVSLNIGDRVRVGVPAHGFLYSAATVYGGPLLAAILAGGMTEWLTAPGHVGVPLAFAGGLLLGWLASRQWLHRSRWRYRPVLLAVLS